jgi:periplasmic divalent cation tolerance protein
MEYVVILITVSSEEEGVRIGKVLVEEGLVACVNIIPNVRSIFKWEGKISDEREHLLICKGKKDKFSKVIERVKELHSYIIPEIISLPIIDGFSDYLNWIDEVTLK